MKPFFQELHFVNNDVFFIFHRDYIPSGMYYPIHFHKAIEVCFILSGEGQANSNDEIAKCQKDNLVIFNSENIHYIKALSGPMIYYCLIINPVLFTDIGFDVERLKFPLVINSDELKQQFNEIVESVNSNDKYSKIITRLKIQIFVTNLIGHYAKGSESTAGHNVKQTNLTKTVIRYINNNYYKKIDFDEMCDELGFSKSYICHTFHEITGQTVTNYANLLRCKKAQVILSTKEYSVKEVAELCGFTNFSYFSKLYKKHIGVLPSKDGSPTTKSKNES